MGSFTSNVKAGLTWGLSFASVFSLVATVLVLLRGPALLREYHTTYLGLVAGYLFGGITAGVITGLLLPLCRHIVGAMLVGFVAILPFGFLTVLTLYPPERWSTYVPIVPVVGSAILGPLAALAIRSGIREGSRGSG
jgi:hypothetical protein